MKKLLLTLIILSVSFCLNGVVYAQEFTNESFQGNYAFSSSSGGRAVVFGVNFADGNGNASGPAVQRVGGRRYEVNLEGTYTVNADGTGIMTGTISDEAGTSPEQTLDFVIMQAEVVNGVKLATEIFVVQRLPLGPPPAFTYKRLPDN
jgi:hypothetical protein